MKKLLILLLITGSATFAQHQPDSSITRKWYVPDHIKMQFAGNIGFISGGPGYISRNKSLETDLLAGFMPEKFGGDALVSISLKTTYSPWRVHLKNNSYIVPFSMGAYLSYTLGQQFESKWPSYYPSGYYWWATAIRSGAYVGGKFGKPITVNKRKSGVELYYELGSYDLLMVSYVQNRKFLSLPDISSLSFGVKLSF
jgi:hypothetical protein